jgi:hypothetical protein
MERETQAAASEWEIATLKERVVQLQTEIKALRAAFLDDEEIAEVYSANDAIAETLGYGTLDYELAAALETSTGAAGSSQLTRTFSVRFPAPGDDQGPAKSARRDSSADGGGF